MAAIFCGATFLTLPLTTNVLGGCSNKAIPSEVTDETSRENTRALASQNLERAIGLVDVTFAAYFDPETFEMRRFYNPFTEDKSDEKASIWMYTAGIEAVNAILAGLNQAKEQGDTELYDQHYDRYLGLLEGLYENADYYLGTFELISYTQTKTWSVYAVDRADGKGQADVTGVLNVYDDQMWLIRELLDSYKLTNNESYLEKAEYLTAYVLDGWDVTRQQDGEESGGIPWGPGYTTKHACSNGPLISSLAWLHEIYRGKPDEIEYRYIDEEDLETRRSTELEKQKYYLDYAQAVYAWQKNNLLNKQGVYTDMMGGCVPNCDVRYQEIDGIRYRAHTPLTEAVGEPLTYNSGTMLSGAADLYRTTGDQQYRDDALALSENAFNSFASLGQDLPQYYSFGVGGFKNWFNGILLRGYHDMGDLDEQTVRYMDAFQRNLDYGFDHYQKDGFLPTNLLTGWADEKEGQGLEGMFMFAYAAQYAILGQHHLRNVQL